MTRLERIVTALGGVVFDGGKRALVPGPGHNRHDRSVSLLDVDGRIVIHCFSPADDWRTVARYLAARGLLDATAHAPAPAPRDGADGARAPHSANGTACVRATRWWTEGRAISHTPAARYLEARAIRFTVCAPSLRFHPRMTSLEDRIRRPALLAAIRTPGGALQGVQATLLSQTGLRKATLTTPRRVIGKLLGGAVRLQPAGETLAIGEGVETMLSASRLLRAPAWAALTAYNLARFEPPRSVKQLIIAVDNDNAGREAARLLARRLSIETNIAAPPGGAEDWNAFAQMMAPGRRRQHPPSLGRAAPPWRYKQ